MANPITVILADNHALVLEGLRSLFAMEADIRTVATAADGAQLLDAVEAWRPDVVISDIQMEALDGLACLARIRQISPPTRVLLLTAYGDGETFQAVLAAGADGLLLKTDPPELAAKAVRQVMAGQLVYPAAARRWLAAPQPPARDNPLSERETDVLRLVAEGLTNAQVGERLHVSANTVKFHLQSVYERLGVSNRTEATRWYIETFG